MPGVRDDDVVTCRTLPLRLLIGEPYPAVQDLQRRFAVSLVLIQFAARLQRDQGLAQRVLVAAVDGVRASATAGRSRA